MYNKEWHKKYYQSHKKVKLEYQKKYNKNHFFLIKKYKENYRKTHKKQRNIYDKEYLKTHNKQCKQRALNYRNNHKEERKEYLRIHKKEIRENRREYSKNYRRNRMKKDINYKLLANLRQRMWKVLKNNSKSAKTIKLISCTIEYLKQHLEKQFTKGMSWDNYGSGWYGKGMSEWHIDHIKPCVSFDLSKEEEQKKCFHYTNLQPLWAKDNLSKGRK